MKIAAQLYSVHQYIGNKEDMRMTFKKVKEMGYDYIQLSGAGYMDQEKADYVASLLKEYNLTICVTHMSYEQLDQELDSLINYHKLWGCNYMGIGSMPTTYRNKEGYSHFATWANSIGRELAKHGLTFVYHNHRFEFERYDGKTGLALLAEGFNEYVQFLLDTYWVQAGGANPVELINQLAGKVDVVHFKDFGIVNDKAIFAEVGSGNLNWNKIIEACQTAGVKYAAVERDSGEVDAFDSLAISRKYLKNTHNL